jgi:hypothetical protein
MPLPPPPQPSQCPPRHPVGRVLFKTPAPPLRSTGRLTAIQVRVGGGPGREVESPGEPEQLTKLLTSDKRHSRACLSEEHWVVTVISILPTAGVDRLGLSQVQPDQCSRSMMIEVRPSRAAARTRRFAQEEGRSAHSFTTHGSFPGVADAVLYGRGKGLVTQKESTTEVCRKAFFFCDPTMCRYKATVLYSSPVCDTVYRCRCVSHLLDVLATANFVWRNCVEW